jgi:hypothetical protein
MNNTENIIRALYNENIIRVYQAFPDKIADTALNNGTFVSPPFKKERMTWIKPSFLWMMYRSGWGTKPNQERILAIDITREGFEWALVNSCLSHFDPSSYSSHEEWKKKLKESPVRIQWDPERDLYLKPLKYRTIQIGLSGIAVNNYINNWIKKITDVTNLCKKIKVSIDDNIFSAVNNLLPKEKPLK